MGKKQSPSNTQKPITLFGAFGKIIPICLLAIMLAGAVISVANDVYAFAKPQKSAVIRLDTPYTANELSKLLESVGIINNAFLFDIYLTAHGHADSVPLLTGEIALNSSMSYRDLLNEIF